LTQDELQALCEQWQARLGLAHWQVQVRQAHLAEMDLRESGADINFSDCRLRAELRLVFPEERLTGFLHDQDEEFLIVHELLHLAFCGFAPKESCVAEEQAVNSLAECLVKLKREVNRAAEEGQKQQSG
jgi:hypothetical protein